MTGAWRFRNGAATVAFSQAAMRAGTRVAHHTKAS